jgi:putative hydrolase of the HAD superfamily
MIFFDIDQTLINHQHAQDAAVELFWQKFAFLLPDSPEEFGKHWQAVMEKRFAIYLQHYEKNWTLFDDVLSCLNVLSNQQLGIISNGNLEQQTKKLCQTGILGRFNIIVISEEVGVSKPKPEIFLTACLRAGVKADQCHYVGDSLQNDALAAEAIGMKGIWLNRKELSSFEIRLPVINNLNDLVTVVS